MSSRPLLPVVVFAFVLLATPAHGRRAPDAVAVLGPEDLDALVARMVGENLPRAFRGRGYPDSPGARAADALAGQRDAAVPALIRGLQSDDHTVRLNVVYVLGRIGTPATLAPRIKAASDAHPGVRALAVGGLPAYGDHEARRALIRALEDADPSVRNAAARAFVPRQGKDEPDGGVRYATASVLIPLLEDPATQGVAADTLGRLGSNVAARPLLKLLTAREKGVRSTAVQALGRLKDKQVAAELTVALRDEDPHVRMYAAEALGQIGDMRATAALVEALSDQETSVRSYAARALGEVGDLRAVPGLVALLDAPDEHVRSAAADALGMIGDPGAVEPLCAALARDGDRAATAAARALGRLRDPRSVGPLTQYLLGPRPRGDHREAANALARIRHPDAVAALVKVIMETPDGGVGLSARRALEDVADVSFAFDPKEKVADWWERNRGHFVGSPAK